MKILQLISSNGFFGAEKVVLELSRQIQVIDHKSYIGMIGVLQKELLSEAEKNKIDVKLFNCNSKLSIKTILEIRKFIKENEIAIIHSHGYKSNFYSLFATSFMNVKRITTCHNWLGNSVKMKFYEHLDRFLLRKFDKVVAVSEDIRQKVIRSGMSPDRITVINNGIDIDRFKIKSEKLKVKKSLGIEEGKKVIGTAGRLSEEKGHIYLLEAFKELSEKFPNIKLLIVGDGPLRESLELGVRSSEIKDKVIFTGIRDDIPRMLSVMDVFVLPSLKEGMPMVLLEAMAAKIPVIATKVGAVTKVIEEEETGILVEPKDVNGISESIIRLLKDNEKTKSLSKKAYDNVKNKFSSTRMANDYLKIYRDLKMTKNNSTLDKNGKIIQVEISGKGGICHYTYNLSMALGKITKVNLITAQNYELNKKEKAFEVIGFFNRIKTNPLFVLRLIQTFRSNEINIIHFQLSQYPAFIMFLCCIARLFTNKKIVITAHNIESHEEKRWEKFIFKMIYKLADKIIVHAEANKLEIKKNFSIDSNKVKVIPHGNYTFMNEKNHPIRVDSHNILFFGYIRRYKGLEYLIKAFSLVKDRIPKAKLFIVGKPVEDFSIYEKEIENLGLKKDVKLNLNYIRFDKTEKYFKKANVVVLPYLNIYQSGVVQLAYGFGRPVVATRVGGLPEVVEVGKSGFLVSPKDSRALVDRIITILENHKLQQRMGRYALHLAKTKFSWDSIAKKTLELYNNIDN